MLVNNFCAQYEGQSANKSQMEVKQLQWTQ
jgi:hypothetical protein